MPKIENIVAYIYIYMCDV